MSLRVHYLNGGYCRHLLAFIDGRTLRMVRFEAVFLAINHPSFGWIVCDTGYGTRFFEATRTWPSRLYRWATPVSLREPVAVTLARIGVVPEEVQHLIITHFHADHIGGLAEFPNARVYYHEHALAPLLGCTPLRQTRAAFLPTLVPTDLADRSSIIGAQFFAQDSLLPFLVFDLFGDGQLKLVALPGHAPGQIGIEYTAGGVRTLYCADAFWRSSQIAEGTDLPRLVQALQWESGAYQETIEKLRTLARANTHRLISCHDEETQRYVTA